MSSALFCILSSSQCWSYRVYKPSKNKFNKDIFSIQAIIYDIKYWLNKLLKEPLISEDFPWKIYFLLNTLSLLFVIFISFYAFFGEVRFKIPLSVYVLSTLVLYLLSGRFDAFIRSFLPLFPIYIFLAHFLWKCMRSKILIGIILSISLILQILLFVYHITGMAVI
jgi:hypothetical protein